MLGIIPAVVFINPGVSAMVHNRKPGRGERLAQAKKNRQRKKTRAKNKRNSKY